MKKCVIFAIFIKEKNKNTILNNSNRPKWHFILQNLYKFHCFENFSLYKRYNFKKTGKLNHRSFITI